MNVVSALFAAPKMALKAKFRLYLEYFLIALLVFTATIALWNEFQNRALSKRVTAQQIEINNANSKALTFELALTEQQKAIEKVNELREIDSTVLSGLQEDLRRIGARDSQINKSIAILEKNSAEVRDYMAGPVPTALACVLDNTCPELAADRGGKAGSGVPSKKHP